MSRDMLHVIETYQEWATGIALQCQDMLDMKRDVCANLLPPGLMDTVTMLCQAFKAV